MPLSPGDRLGPYQIVAAIGAGGMGEVYKATDTRLGRTVAIKTLNASQSQRFQQEARAIAALNHPNICVLHDIGPDYLVMEHIEGEPLSSRLAGGAMPMEESLQLAVQIASALEAAHGKGILHRDLKPANIMVTGGAGAMVAKLLDFGLAKHTADSESDATQTLAGTVMGTAAYMSPEQAQALSVDARSDIFSFGAVLYEMFSGKRAFAGLSMLETLNAVVRDEPVLPEAPASAVIRRCLAKQPAQRFQTMAELKGALRQLSMQSSGGALQPVERSPASPASPSIAVLPFANMSGDKEQEYFSDGLAEEIINALVKVPGLRVIARTSAFAFKGQNTDIRKIAETLGVNTVLEGSVRRSGNRVRVTAQLITAADGSHLWSERYDREMADVFAVQDEISAAISEALQVKLAPKTAARAHYTPKLPAYEALLKAKHFHWKITAESMEQAKGFYEQAIALDPQYALAHALYADYLYGRTTVGMSSMREVAETSRALARRALELEPSLPEAHATLGILAAGFDFNWEEAERECMAGTASATASPHCYFTHAMFLLSAGRVKDAQLQLERALQGDPLHLTSRVYLGICMTGVGRYAEPEEQFRQVMQLDANFFWAHIHLAELYVAREMFNEALAVAEKAYSLSPWYSPSIGLYAGLLVRTGHAERGEELAQQLGSGDRFQTASGWAIYYTCCGDIDRAADWYEKSIEERDSLIGQNLYSAIGEPLRASPRWPKLAALRNLPVSGA